MTTAIYTHPDCLNHRPGRHHPERPSRIAAALDGLKEAAIAGLEPREAPGIDPALLQLVHPSALVDRVLAPMRDDERRWIDGDTVMSAGSAEAALRAAGAVCDAIDAVMAGHIDNAFCAVRPPGHHAEPGRAMGFCLFNNVAVGALYAREKHGLGRLAAIDFDVHHGNGTQAAFESDGDLFYASTHQWPLYPGTGAASETGVGNICNVPLAPGSGSREFRRAMSETVLPALEAFRPDMILVSAGFDAHKDDPLAGLKFHTEDYGWATERIAGIAAGLCDGRMVSALEGGYDLQALADSVVAHVGALAAAGPARTPARISSP